MDQDRYKEGRINLLLVTGSLNYDITFYVDYFAPPKSVIKKLVRYLGGSGGNAAVAAARMLRDMEVVFLGAVGNDEIGQKHIEALKSEKIDTSLILRIDGVESGQAFVAVRGDGATAIYSYYGANHMLKPDLIDAKVSDYILRSKAVLIMNPPLETCIKVAEIAKKSGKTVFWDPGALSKLGLGKLEPMIKLVDYLAPNHGELLTLTKERNELSAVLKLLNINPSIRVISKKGKEGSALYDPVKSTVTYVSAVDPRVFGLKVVSTVGCGDAYIGVFAALKHDGYDDLEAMKIATCAASVNAAFENPRNVPPKNVLLDKYMPVCRNNIKVMVKSF